MYARRKQQQFRMQLMLDVLFVTLLGVLLVLCFSSRVRNFCHLWALRRARSVREARGRRLMTV